MNSAPPPELPPLRWRNWPWAAKLALLLAALTVLPLTVVTLANARAARAELLAAAQAQNLQQARTTAGAIDRYLDDVKADLLVIARAPSTAQLLAAPPERALREDVETSLRTMRDTHTFHSLYLLDLSGTVAVATDGGLLGRAYLAAPHFLSAKAGLASIGEPRYDPQDQESYLHVSAPVQSSSGAILGVAVGRILVSHLDEIVRGDEGFAGRREYGVLWNRDGIRLSHPLRPDLRFRPLGPLPADVQARLEAEKRFGPQTSMLLEPAAPSPEVLEQSRWLLYNSKDDPMVRFKEGGEVMHGALTPLASQRWIYGIFSPESAMLAEVRRQTRSNLLLAVVTAVLATVLAFFAARWATGPLRLVGHTARALAEGDMSRRVGLRQGDEVGRLAAAFDSMADSLAEKEAQLRGYADQLEQRVAEQTAALRASEEELRALFEREQEARRKAEEANRIKDEFLSTVSHELRTPLNAILGWTWLLKGGKLDPEGLRRAVETIERNARSQGQIIDDLLDVSRIITGKLPLKIRRLDLIQVIEAAIDSIRPAAEAKSIQLEARLGPEAATLSGDPGRLQQVIWNLLSNAVKFTPEGGHVEISLRREDHHACIEVKDSGMGIRPDFLGYVFDRFRQADSSTTRQHGGLGLGLAIVRHLVELHGGTVAVHSEGEGMGAAFTVRLPQGRFLRAARVPEAVGALEGGKAGTDGGPPSRAANAQLQGWKVLLVDDEEDTREVVSAALEEFGAAVMSAATAAEAVEAMSRFAPDVLVADIGMPGEDGYSLIRRVRGLAGDLGTTPAVALTAYAAEADRQRALAAGFQLHLPKPVEPQMLAAAVATLAERAGGRG